MLELVGKKIGMSHLYSDQGNRVPVTLVKMYDCCVSDFIVNNNKIFNNIILAYDKVEKATKLTKPIKGIYQKKGLDLYRKRRGVKVEKEETFKIGDILGIEKLKEGDVVNVSGVSVGKGFAGVMKKYNFKGLRASHGVSVSHRSGGSTGQCQDPGKVFKGKKMPGQMGNKTTTVKNLEIKEINKETKVIYVKGAIPGHKNSEVIIKLNIN